MNRKINIAISVMGAAAVAVMLAACGNADNGKKPDETPANEYGTVSISDCKVYITSDKNYTFDDITPVFSKPDKAETLVYEYDEKELKIENGTVIPLKRADKTLTVKAKSEHFSTEFDVDVELIPLSGGNMSPLYDLSAFNIAAGTTACASATANTTLFLGDSFMDSYFIGDYMATYKVGKDVINAGISSTTSYHWEAAYGKIIGTTAPKNIALHIGTNNFYDAHDDAESTRESLTRLFMMMHNSYPATKLYWFNITQRTDTQYAGQVTETNAYMAEWCAKYDWIACVDTCSQITGGMLRDGIHPKTENYKVFTDALVAAGCEIANK